ncbi:hypothetical protein PENTCL1PPCAC_29688, partial [Pristionchus entomophagus]
ASSTTCYPPITTSTLYDVLKTATVVETRRGCEVLCDAEGTCAAFSFNDNGFASSCVLLSTNSKNLICSTKTTIFLKTTTGCLPRTNITDEIGVDPCIDEIVP